MSRSAMIVLVGILAGPLALGWWSAARWHRAEEAVRRGTRQYEQTAAEVSEMLALQTRRQRVSLAERPPQDVIAHVNEVLAEAGLPGNHFKRLTAEGDVALPRGPGPAGPEYRRQSVRLILQAMTVQELGLFLSEWRPAHSGTRAWYATDAGDGADQVAVRRRTPRSRWLRGVDSHSDCNRWPMSTRTILGQRPRY